MKNLIDLHLHLDGSLSLKAVKKLAEMQNIEISENDEEIIKKIKVDKNCKDLNDYLTKFDFPLSLLQNPEAVEFAVFNLLNELKEQGFIYAEIRFAPQLHTKNGFSQEDILKGAIKGINKSEIKANLILCCMRQDKNKAENIETINISEKYLNKGVCAIDLAGAEALYKTSDFEYIFDIARKKKIPFTIHCGEADGAESIKKALEFGAKRLGHGVRSAEDINLLKYIAQNNIMLELCPTSNLNTNIFEKIEDYPIRKFMEYGVKITINTDNMTVSDTTVENELNIIKNAFSLSDEDIKKFLINSIDFSFADKITKEKIKNILINN